MKRYVGLIFVLIFAVWINNIQAQAYTQSGNKLVAADGISAVGLGFQVAVSYDGNTFIAGGRWDNYYQGAAWIFSRENGLWTQQGNKLVGNDAVGAANQGVAVAISYDGNTAIIGGPGDNNNAGAAWIFIRENGVWHQEGSKLVGTGAIGAANQGGAVSISGDGNTVTVGGSGDNNHIGATWVFVRQNGIWTQQGEKLVGNGYVGQPYQGPASLSSDGNTLVMTGPNDNSGIGAAWVFTRNNNIWTQQGEKLFGNGVIGSSNQGNGISMAADGNTFAIGGDFENGGIGATWIFTREAGVWSQQGSKLVGSGGVGTTFQGQKVSLSPDGNTVAIGGWNDNNQGAVWIFTRENGVWTQFGNKLVGTGAIGHAHQGASVALSNYGETLIEGADYDNNYLGAVWVFARPAVSIKGKVTLNGTGLSTVKLFLWNKDNLPYENYSDPVITDASGNFTFNNVPFEEGLLVFLMEPFGYKANANPQSLIINLPGISASTNPDLKKTAGTVSTQNLILPAAVNFTLTKTLSKNQTMPSAYWGSQFNYYFTHKGTKAVETEANLLKYIDAVQKHYTPYFNIFQDKLSISDWYHLFYDKTTPTMLGGARAEIASLVLNIASLKLPQYLSVTMDNRTAGEALTKLSQMFISANGSSSVYQTIFNYGYKINTKQKLAKNIIPPSNILYKTARGPEEISGITPDKFQLYSNYPNPFNPSTTIQFDIADLSEVSIIIYDIQGRVVETVFKEIVQPGSYKIQWNASMHPSGIYFCSITAGSFRDVKKMLLLR